MKNFKSYFYTAFIKSQVWVSLCIAFLVLYIQEIHHLHVPHIVWLVFFSTLLAYNMAYWVVDYKSDERLAVMLLSGILSIYLFFQLNSILAQVLILLAGCVSIFYSLPIYQSSLRQIPQIKIILIALVWSTAVNITLIESSLLYLDEFIWSFVAIFLFVIGITIPFDIRDYHIDNKSLKTIPQQYGINKSKIIAGVLLIISVYFLQLSVHDQYTNYIMIYVLTVFIAIFMIYRQKPHSNLWYTSFWIEGISALPFLIFKILSYIIS
ncbi:MAG: hypothetical protein ACR2MS_10380 [Weeksellaceae bacterium]